MRRFELAKQDHATWTLAHNSKNLISAQFQSQIGFCVRCFEDLINAVCVAVNTTIDSPNRKTAKYLLLLKGADTRD